MNKRYSTIGKIVLSLSGVMVLTLVLGGCKSTKKAAAYEAIFKEKPVTIYTAPLEDKSHRKANRSQSDIDYNNELNLAATYMFQTLADPLNNQGYYVLGTLSAKQLSNREKRTAKELLNGDIREYNARYGVDAILYARILRWWEQNSEWGVYVEYILRSTKSNTELMHTWVKASKKIPVDTKGNPVPLREDVYFADKMGLDVMVAERCILVEKVSDFVLHNLPTSPERRQYERDIYAKANPAYFAFVIERDGGIEVQKTSMESFEEDCFVN